jgi:signal peptidase I
MAGTLAALRNFSTGFLMSLPVLVAVSDNIVGINKVHGDSMLPCLQHGDIILVAKYTPHH